MKNNQLTRVLLHTCCGPCLTHVFSILASQNNVHVFYYNPNISPLSEYKKRLFEVERFSQQKSIPVTIGQYNQKEWFHAVKPNRFYGEFSPRCHVCYAFRLKETFKIAREHKYDAVCTTLTVSPYKDAEKINEIGRKLSKAYNITYMPSDFKSNSGYQHSIKLSKQYGMYRQKYCGCIYSKLERNKYSLWSKRVHAFKELYNVSK